MVITSVHNAKIKQWVKYKEKKFRDQEEMFLVEGEHLVHEAHQAKCIQQLIVVEGYDSIWKQYPTTTVTKEVMKKLCSSVSGSNIMAICNYMQFHENCEERLIILDNVQDPGNVGTIIRTAHSFGYTGVVLSNGCADLYNEKVIRSTQGALFHIPVKRCDLQTYLPTLQRKGVQLLATALQDANKLQQVQPKNKFALILGNEGKGVRQEILSMCEDRVFIEMKTFESLNVAIAAGICMYQFMDK